MASTAQEMLHDQSAPFAVVVDDNPVILLSAACMIEDVGFSVFAAADAEAAHRWLNEYDGSISLLFTNVHLPGEDGFSLAQTASQRWPTIGIIAASGCVEPMLHDLPDCAIFLQKPYLPSQVGEAVHQVLLEKHPELIRLLDFEKFAPIADRLSA